MARPQKEISEAVVRGMAGVGATNIEIAEFSGVSVDTLTRRFADVLTKSRANMSVKLRRAQMKLALSGNATMQIWLGKNGLGQSDKVEVDPKSVAETARAIRDALATIDADPANAA